MIQRITTAFICTSYIRQLPLHVYVFVISTCFCHNIMCLLHSPPFTWASYVHLLYSYVLVIIIYLQFCIGMVYPPNAFHMYLPYLPTHFICICYIYLHLSCWSIISSINQLLLPCVLVISIYPIFVNVFVISTYSIHICLLHPVTVIFIIRNYCIVDIFHMLYDTKCTPDCNARCNSLRLYCSNSKSLLF